MTRCGRHATASAATDPPQILPSWGCRRQAFVGGLSARSCSPAFSGLLRPRPEARAYPRAGRPGGRSGPETRPCELGTPPDCSVKSAEVRVFNSGHPHRRRHKARAALAGDCEVTEGVAALPAVEDDDDRVASDGGVAAKEEQRRPGRSARRGSAGRPAKLTQCVGFPGASYPSKLGRAKHIGSAEDPGLVRVGWGVSSFVAADPESMKQSDDCGAVAVRGVTERLGARRTRVLVVAGTKISQRQDERG